jgi:heme oxygenase (mycobilin-producing)
VGDTLGVRGAGDMLERRFATRAGLVENAPGFERFELFRPLEGTETYLADNRWRSREPTRLGADRAAVR